MVNGVLQRLGLKKSPVAIKVLTIVTYIRVFICLRPVIVRPHLCVDYYGSDWAPEDGAMFGREYPGIAMGLAIQALRDAENYAAENGYGKLIIKRVIIPGVTESI